MDILPDSEPDQTQLSYDDSTPGPSQEKKGLLARIGQSRVYALEDTSAASLLGASKKVNVSDTLYGASDGLYCLCFMRGKLELVLSTE